jgi:NAD(P)-dependent dehydrogenase (short-subunit alcohol dehydrogenase family)
VTARTPTRRLARMADVIDTVFFLLDNQSINGVDVALDGGIQVV